MRRLLVPLSLLLATPALAQPQTLEEAVAQVRAVTHPTPHQQARLRAREAMAIVGERVTVVNDASSFCAIVAGLGDDELAMMDQIDAARDAGTSLAQAAWDAGGGRCAEHGDLMAHLLREAGERVIVLSSTAGHAFPLVHYADGFDPDNPWTWGEHAFIADTWLENAWGHVGLIDDPEDAWDDNWIFGDGRYVVTSGNEGLSTRQRMEFYLRRGRGYIEQRCPTYRETLAAFLRYPEEVREDLAMTPPAGVCGASPPPRADPTPSVRRDGYVSCPAPPGGFDLRPSTSWSEPTRPPGQIARRDDEAEARCVYGVQGEEQAAFSVTVEWGTDPEHGRQHMCSKPAGEPLMASTGTWRLSFGAQTTEEWRGPYDDTLSLGVSFSRVYSSHQRLAWVSMSEYREGVFRHYAHSDWRRDAATHLLAEAAPYAWRCP